MSKWPHSGMKITVIVCNIALIGVLYLIGVAAHAVGWQLGLAYNVGLRPVEPAFRMSKDNPS